MENCSKMTDISTQTNIQAHYTSNPKVQRTPKAVVAAPENLPQNHLFNDRDATNRFRAINKDIYLEAQSEKKNDFRTFMLAFGVTLAAIFGFKAIKNLFKKS